MLDAIGYLVDNGIKWRAMPADFPPWDRVYAFFRRWRDHDLVREFHDRLRGQVRERAGRDALPTAGVIDSQSVKALWLAPAAVASTAASWSTDASGTSWSTPSACCWA
jgi:transposase